MKTKKHELSERQRKVATQIDMWCCDVIGEYQIMLDEAPDGSDELTRAITALSSPEFLYQEVLDKFLHMGTWNKDRDMRLVTLDWVKDRIRKRVEYYRQNDNE